MKLAVLDLHRLKTNKVQESIKIANVLKEYLDGEVIIYEMIRNDPPNININEFSGIVVSGSDSPHVEKYRGYKITRKIIDEAREKSIPVLALCAGSQMLAKMFGHDIEFMDKPEMGWYEIELNDKGMKDDLFKGLPKAFVSFAFHIKRVCVNETNNIKILARSKNCIHAVKYDKFIWGIQFHPEDTIEEGNEQIKNYTRAEPTKNSAVPPPEKLVCKNIYKNFIEIANKKGKYH